MMEALAEESAEVAASKAMDIYNKLKAKYPTLFTQLQQMVPHLEIIYNSVIEPLLPELEKAVKMIEKQAVKIWPNVDRPESVANETVGRWSHCAWKNTRRYISLKNVDVGNTMACSAEKSWVTGRYVCWCAGTFDCYVTKGKRPDPVELKRCFRPEEPKASTSAQSQALDDEELGLRELTPYGP